MRLESPVRIWRGIQGTGGDDDEFTVRVGVPMTVDRSRGSEGVKFWNVLKAEPAESLDR